MDSVDLLAILGVLVMITLVVGVAALLWARRQQRSTDLQANFGPEYSRAVSDLGSRRMAEKELLRRQQRMQKVEIRMLYPEERDRFGAAWSNVQHRFVDDPMGAVREADMLVKDVMMVRGYPMDNFEQRVADLSVDHAGVVQHYRAARMLAAASADGKASTEDLRQAMVHYRALFADMLETAAPAAALREVPV